MEYVLEIGIVHIMQQVIAAIVFSLSLNNEVVHIGNNATLKDVMRDDYHNNNLIGLTFNILQLQYCNSSNIHKGVHPFHLVHM